MPGTQRQTEILTVTELPEMFAVILHNDDYTPMDFVVLLLMKVFSKSAADASALMMDIHNRGKAEAGVYTLDIAVTKKLQSDQMSEAKGHPLKVTVESLSSGI